MADIAVLDIFLGDTHIGNLTLLDGERSILSFRDDYVENPDRPTLSLSLKDPYGGIITNHNPSYPRIPVFFSNLLPESPLRDYLATRAGIKDMDEFSLLWALGQDLPGNVTIRPSGNKDWPVLPTHILTGEEITAKKNNAMRFSLTGGQFKFSAIMEDTGNLTIPADGTGGSWIIKLPSSHYEGIPENEYSMMRLAERIGMNVPQVKLINLHTINGLPYDIGNMAGRALAIERFDRNSQGDRIHMEDFAQIFGIYADKKYERGNYGNIAEVIWAETGEDGLVEFIKRFTFNALIGNTDMHMKNWSLIYPDGISAEMAPCYDFLSTIPYILEKDMALKLIRGGSKRLEDLTLESFTTFAAKAKLPKTIVLNTVRETVSRFHDVWPRGKQHLPIEDHVALAIDNHLKTLPLAQVK